MNHIPVLTNEVILVLDPKPNQNFIDATLGFGGHAKLILKKTAPEGKLLGIEQDIEALKASEKNLEDFGERFSYYHGNFTNLGLIIRDWKVDSISGILCDLGVSTYQLSTKDRGFSFSEDAPLDMRMDQTRQKLTAENIVNNYSVKSLNQILFQLGEERFAKKIVDKIILARKEEPIRTTSQLVKIIKSTMPPSYRYNRDHHFATSTFRALRMAVNDELGNLKKILSQVYSVLPIGGRVAIISFHSLEDRIVKNFFKNSEHWKIINQKPITATNDESIKNPSSRSAKLRAAIKVNNYSIKN